MRALGLCGLLLLCACSGGLKLDEGNAFPCDFALGEAVRDQGCPSGWVCGLEDRCQPEDPETFVPGAVPSYAAQARVSPGALDSPLRLLAGDARLRLWLADEDDAAGPLLVTPVGVAPLSPNAPLPELSGAALAGAQLGLLTSTGNVALVNLADGGTQAVLTPGTGKPLGDVGALRAELSVLADGGVGSSFLAALRTDGGAGELRTDGTYQALPQAFTVDANGGAHPCTGGKETCAPRVDDTVWSYAYTDVRAAPRAQVERLLSAKSALVPVAAYGPGLLARLDTPLAGDWRVLNRNDPLIDDAALLPLVDLRHSQLRRSEDGALWALNYALPVPARVDSLATWVLSRSTDPTQNELVRAWSDCAPCREGRLLAATPVTGGALGVEVLCEASGGARSLWRVTGASVTSPLDACLREPVEAPFDLAQLSADPNAVDATQGASLSLGGRSGQVWFGPRLSTARPLYLDRAPLAATLVTDAASAGKTNLAAITESTVAVDLGRPGGNGLTVLTLAELNAANGVADPAALDERFQLAARVEGFEDWFVLSSGDLVKTGAGGGFGPRLLAPDGSPAQGPFHAVGTREGSRASMVLSAADQLYYWELDPAAPLSAQAAASTLAPRLTPEPGFPIRSLARNRAVTLAGSSELDVAGWVVTSRNLFAFSRVRAGGRWALEGLSASVDEPVELWSVGEPPAAYGRVGLRDGTVLRLPGGLPLTGRLVREDGRAEQVRDYASVGGWTLALGEAGLYQAVTPTAAGKLLAWTAVPLPAGVTGAQLAGARLEVLRREGRDMLYLFTAQGFAYEVGRAQSAG
ncbi:hypothetical protein FGE12_22760 [Aggregicoccus sp. 17bor-14]|uniref:hypothetical protein n=1 Tax=Myxococcaceae TaxID=31 RepID=UPI00129C80A9|nr:MULTISPECIES: hypothetical protein [Myxococcaceae]MBF5045244.1 hypothetical protein [Simulacricoccus sp. 17bor-14]MRI90985.1 hypothetical protein [Aggregicoccus sp. 17bor-14]